MISTKIIASSFALALLVAGVGCTNKNEAQFRIPELSLDLTMPRAVAEDLTYQISEVRGDKVAMLNSKKLMAAAPEDCKPSLGLGPIGNVYKQVRLEDPTGGPRTATEGRDFKVGDYHLSYLKPITTCAGGEALKTYQNDTVRAFEAVWAKLDTSGLPQKFMQ